VACLVVDVWVKEARGCGATGSDDQLGRGIGASGSSSKAEKFS
jgi:hypothetical protein